MECVFKMDMSNLGPFAMKEAMVGNGEGLHACQDCGKTIGKNCNRRA